MRDERFWCKDCHYQQGTGGVEQKHRDSHVAIVDSILSHQFVWFMHSTGRHGTSISHLSDSGCTEAYWHDIGARHRSSRVGVKRKEF
jgi:hypothetical protein